MLRRTWSGRGPHAVLSYPLAHGGAVRICHLVRQMAEEFDEELFAFQDKSVPPETAPVLEFCARVVLVESRGTASRAGLLCCRPTSASFDRRPRAAHLAAERRGFGFDLLQVECAQLAPYGGDVLVEHDVTFDLFSQIARRDGTLSSWWTTGAGSGWRGGHHMLSPRGGDVGKGR